MYSISATGQRAPAFIERSGGEHFDPAKDRGKDKRRDYSLRDTMVQPASTFIQWNCDPVATQVHEAHGDQLEVNLTH
ncbi:hypothetical protein [Phyllobacterium lublinensis]|uniref:hypothetical protein n=1 Tax=Phyllobacterium lublinensis TaxID=2875708 RepID=UPI001CCFFB31|nr:hypothetical protein [Phyllobacterium sp. 2063]MBZ9655794.1 hypothetical protein [Phyllobacterium sp. 2063]